MQTRSGKTYNTSTTSSKEKKNIRLKMKVDNVDNLITLRMQTRSGKTYTATSSFEKSKPRVEMKVDNVENVVNRTRLAPTPISTDRRPMGFTAPLKISNELAMFLGKPVGTEMARTDVTRELNKYIHAHNLQDKENGRKIHPDAKLRSLLRLGQNDELNYFNLQKYMRHHFIRDN